VSNRIVSGDPTSVLGLGLGLGLRLGIVSLVATFTSVCDCLIQPIFTLILTDSVGSELQRCYGLGIWLTVAGYGLRVEGYGLRVTDYSYCYVYGCL